MTRKEIDPRNNKFPRVAKARGYRPVFGRAKDERMRVDAAIEDLRKHVNDLSSSAPHYDSGYFYAEAAAGGGNIYEFHHNFGVMPSRYRILLASADPDAVDEYSVYDLPSYLQSDRESGMVLRHKSHWKYSEMQTGNTYLYYPRAAAWVRVMFWR